MDDFVSPARKVLAAMPGTLAELSEATGYPPAEVMKQIGNARRVERVNVVALPGRRGEDGWEPTTYINMGIPAQKGDTE